MMSRRSPSAFWAVLSGADGLHGDIESAPSNERCIDVAPVDPSAELRLLVYPNPCNPHTEVCFHLARLSYVRLTLYDARGRLIKTLASRKFSAGDPVVGWDGLGGDRRGVAAGTDFMTLQVGATVETRQITLVK